MNALAEALRSLRLKVNHEPTADFSEEPSSDTLAWHAHEDHSALHSFPTTRKTGRQPFLAWGPGHALLTRKDCC